MAYVEVDQSKMWTAEESLNECSQVVQMVAADTPYVAVDFGMVLDRVHDLAIQTFTAVTEKDGKTISLTEESISEDKKKVSFKVASNDGAGDYVLRVPVVLNKGTTNQISRDCILRVV